MLSSSPPTFRRSLLHRGRGRCIRNGGSGRRADPCSRCVRPWLCALRSNSCRVMLWLACRPLCARRPRSPVAPAASGRFARPGLARRRRLAVGETVILLHRPLPSAGVSIAMERERQQNDSLANGYHRHSRSSACSGQHRGSPRRRRPPAWSLRSSVAAAAAAAVIISTAFRRRCRKPTARHSAGPKTLPPAEIAERVFPDGWLFGKREVYLVHAVGWRRVLGRDCRVDPLHCVPDAVEDQWP